MKKSEVEIGKVYKVKVSGVRVPVRLVSECPYGGWYGKNLETGRRVRIKTAARLRYEVIERDGPYAERTVDLGDGRIVQVKGRGFVTYWKFTGRPGDNFLLASPDMRRDIKAGRVMLPRTDEGPTVEQIDRWIAAAQETQAQRAAKMAGLPQGGETNDL